MKCVSDFTADLICSYIKYLQQRVFFALPNASGSFLQKCSFVEQQLKFSHFEGII